MTIWIISASQEWLNSLRTSELHTYWLIANEWCLYWLPVWCWWRCAVWGYKQSCCTIVLLSHVSTGWRGVMVWRNIAFTVTCGWWRWCRRKWKSWKHQTNNLTQVLLWKLYISLWAYEAYNNVGQRNSVAEHNGQETRHILISTIQTLVLWVHLPFWWWIISAFFCRGLDGLVPCLSFAICP